MQRAIARLLHEQRRVHVEKPGEAGAPRPFQSGERPQGVPFIDGIEYGGPEPLFTDYKGFQNAMIAMVQSVVTGDAEPQAALDKASEELEDYK